jgi:hypothetical protein
VPFLDELHESEHTARVETRMTAEGDWNMNES